MGSETGRLKPSSPSDQIQTEILLYGLGFRVTYTHTHTTKIEICGCKPCPTAASLFLGSFHKGKVRILEKTTNGRFPNCITARFQKLRINSVQTLLMSTAPISVGTCERARANSAAHALDLVHRFLHIECCD